MRESYTGDAAMLMLLFFCLLRYAFFAYYVSTFIVYRRFAAMLSLCRHAARCLLCMTPPDLCCRPERDAAAVITTISPHAASRVTPSAAPAARV